MKKTGVSLLVFFVIAFLCFWSSESLANKHHGMPIMAEGEYFSIYAKKNIGIIEILSKIDFDYLPYTKNSTNNYEEDIKLSNILSKTLDALFLEVSDILDTHIYGLNGNIVVLNRQKDVANIFKMQFDIEMSERAFYSHEEGTIYISFEDLTLGMLGHEMAHAIISHFFIVPPPPTIQEVLCGYVEFKLRKRANLL